RASWTVRLTVCNCLSSTCRKHRVQRTEHLAQTRGAQGSLRRVQYFELRDLHRDGGLVGPLSILPGQMGEYPCADDCRNHPLDMSASESLHSSSAQTHNLLGEADHDEIDNSCRGECHLDRGCNYQRRAT